MDDETRKNIISIIDKHEEIESNEYENSDKMKHIHYAFCDLVNELREFLGDKL